MKGVDGQMECIGSMLGNGHGACSKTDIAPTGRSGVLRFGGILSRFIERCQCLLCVFIAVFVCCVSPFIGASKRPSIDPLDLLDVFFCGASCLERAMYSLYTLARSDHEAIRLSVVCMV